MTALILLIDTVLAIYMWLVIARAISSWLVAFDVINTRNRFVYMIMDFLHRVTEPVLRPLRSIIPDLGGVDITPVILLLGIWFARQLLILDILPALAG